MFFSTPITADIRSYYKKHDGFYYMLFVTASSLDSLPYAKHDTVVSALISDGLDPDIASALASIELQSGIVLGYTYTGKVTYDEAWSYADAFGKKLSLGQVFRVPISQMARCEEQMKAIDKRIWDRASREEKRKKMWG